MDAAQKVVKARTGLILDHPFFGSLALKLILREDQGCQTGWTDGKYLGFNPQWIDNLTLAQTKGFVAHEVLHIAFLHHVREGERDHQKWNMAADYAINLVLQDANFDMPEGVLINSAYKDMSAEKIYGIIPDPPKGGGGGPGGLGGGRPGQGDGQGSGGDDPGGFGEVRKPKGKDGGAMSPAELAEAEAEAKIGTAQAAQAAKACGKLPASLARLVGELLEPKVDWRSELRRFMAQVAKNDYTFRRCNTRYLASGFYLPALYSEEMPPIVVAVDTSGSISGPELDQFTGELNAIREEGQANTVHVVYCDAEVAGTQEFQKDDPLEIKAKGGGGTSFVPPFEWVDEQGIEPSCLIYLTDGYCSSFPPAPAYPTLWVVLGAKSFDPPFGEVIEIGE